MPGLEPGIHADLHRKAEAWMAGSSPAMTRGALQTILAQAAAGLKAAGVEGARRDARILLAEVLGLPSNANLPDGKLTAAQSRRFKAMVARRMKREPVSRILGRRDFWTLTLKLNKHTLDPRPDSETLVEATLAHLKDRTRAYRLLDLGTGTGCLLLALLKELPNATGLGVDISPLALKAARANARQASLAVRARFARGDWAAKIAGKFDLIVANPPYIPSAEIALLDPEVKKFDPHGALDGGRDGLAAYRAIARELPGLLARHALVAVEIGQGQARRVAAILKAQGLQILETRHDLAGIERCIIATGGWNRHSREKDG
jgi:release factor glutamine methyltransferase